MDVAGVCGWFLRDPQYLPRRYYFRAIDLIVSGAFGAIASDWPPSTSLAHAAATWGILAVMMGALAAYQPYTRDMRWVRPWKLVHYILIAVIAALTYVEANRRALSAGTLALVYGGDIDQLAGLGKRLAYATLALSVLFLVGVSLGFIAALYAGAKLDAGAEARALVEGAVAMQAAARAAAIDAAQSTDTADEEAGAAAAASPASPHEPHPPPSSRVAFEPSHSEALAASADVRVTTNRQQRLLAAPSTRFAASTRAIARGGRDRFTGRATFAPVVAPASQQAATARGAPGSGNGDDEEDSYGAA